MVILGCIKVIFSSRLYLQYRNNFFILLFFVFANSKGRAIIKPIIELFADKPFKMVRGTFNPTVLRMRVLA